MIKEIEMKNKSVIIKIVFCAAIFVLFFTLTTCETLKNMVREPVVSFKSVDIASITFTGVDLLCKVNVENPNPLDIPFPELAWEVFLNANHFINGTIRNGGPIRSYGTTVVEVPVSLTYLDILNTFSSLAGANEVDFKIPLNFKFNIPVIGEKSFQLEPSGTVPILQLPTLSFGGISVKNISLTSLDFEVNWEIENKNSVAMLVNEITYNLTINNSQWASGTTSKNIQIAPNQKGNIPIPISLNNLAIISGIGSLITRGTDVACVCGGNLNVGLNIPGFKNYSFPFNYSGVTKLSR